MKIVTISMIRDEDLFIEQVIRNVMGFSDEVIVCDHKSRDRTREIVDALARECSKVSVVSINAPRESQRYIRGLAGTDTWVFGVDGDEVYDPLGLCRMREDIFAGRYDHAYCVYGNVLNCESIDRAGMQASGFLAPPCRSMTKLYNFNSFTEWIGDCPERLHGRVRFKSGFGDGVRVNLHEKYSWEESPFRCLHLAFVRRSSRQQEGVARLSSIDAAHGGARERLVRWARMLLGREAGISTWKNEKYRRGELVTKGIREFFPDPRC